MTVYWYWDGKAWYPQYVEDGHYDLQYHNPFFGHEHYDFDYYRSPYARSRVSTCDTTRSHTTMYPGDT